MDTTNPVIQLCIQGTRAEFARQLDTAQALYWQAWTMAQDDYEACIAAHYVARFQESPEATLHWNLEAFHRAQAAPQDRVRDFYPSLYLNLGKSYERLGQEEEAKRCYELAARD